MNPAHRFGSSLRSVSATVDPAKRRKPNNGFASANANWAGPPGHLIVLSSYVGLELAQAYRRFGSL
jgi:pyruvate/2-oxoglutarate dehydrogenase complex dihydrolipoamide dehydrogenase (E3) component